MDFLDPAKKQAHKRRLFLGYFLVGTLIIIGSIIILFQTYGFDVNRQTGSVIQNGLVYISSSPVSSTVYINGQQKDATNVRYTLPSGKYALELRKSGYNTWKRSITLDGGAVERLTYPRLFPTKLVISDVKLYGSQPAFTSQSPDKNWLIAGLSASSPTFDVYDLTKPQNDPVAESIPSTILTQSTGAQSFTPIEWSSDNRHVLIKHSYKGGFEYVIFDRQVPTSSFNVNKKLNVPLPKLSLLDNKYDRYYIFNTSTHVLQTADLKNTTPKTVLKNVLVFTPRGADIIIYVSSVSSVPGTASLHLRIKSKDTLLRTFPTKTNYLLDIYQYSNDWYAIAGAVSEGRFSIYKNPQNYSPSNHLPFEPISVLKMSKADYVSFSPNTQFICVQSVKNFGVYDIESDRRYYYAEGTGIASSQQAQWMDDYHLSLNSQSKTVVFDFDGTNMQTIAPIADGFIPAFSPDLQKLFTIGPSVTVPKHSALTMTNLVAQ